MMITTDFQCRNSKIVAIAPKIMAMASKIMAIA